MNDTFAFSPLVFWYPLGVVMIMMKSLPFDPKLVPGLMSSPQYLQKEKQFSIFYSIEFEHMKIHWYKLLKSKSDFINHFQKYIC